MAEFNDNSPEIPQGIMDKIEKHSRELVDYWKGIVTHDLDWLYGVCVYVSKYAYFIRDQEVDGLKLSEHKWMNAANRAIIDRDSFKERYENVHECYVELQSQLQQSNETIEELKRWKQVNSIGMERLKEESDKWKKECYELREKLSKANETIQHIYLNKGEKP